MRITFLILLTFFFLSPERGESQDYNQLTIDDGLPSNLVYGVLEDIEGYLWFYTDNGVIKYDGYDLKVFGYAAGLPDTDIWYMHEDMYKRKWLINFTSVNYYIQNDSIQKLDFDISPTTRPDRLCFIEEGLIYNSYKEIFVVAGDDITRIKLDPKDLNSSKKAIENLKISEYSKDKLRKHIKDEGGKLDLNHFLAKNDNQDKKKTFTFSSEDLKIEVHKYEPKIRLKNRQHSFEENLENHGLQEINTVRKSGNILILDHTKGRIKYDIEKETIIDEIFVPTKGIRLTRGIKIGDKFFSGSTEDGVIIYNLESQEKKNSDSHYQAIGVDENEMYFLEDNLKMWVDGIADVHNPVDNNIPISGFNKVLKRKGKIYGIQKDIIYSLTDQSIALQIERDSFYSAYESKYKLLEIEAPKDVLFTDSLCIYIQYSVIYTLEREGESQWGGTISGYNFYSVEHYRDTYIAGSTDGIFEIGNMELLNSSLFPQFKGRKVNKIKNLGNDQLAIVSNASKLDIYRNDIKQFEYQFEFPISTLSQYDSLLYGRTGNTIFRIQLRDSLTSDRLFKKSFSSFDNIQDIECNSNSIYIASEAGYYKIDHEDFEESKGDIRMVSLKLNDRDGLISSSLDIPSNENTIDVRFKALSVSSLANIRYNFKLIPGDTIFNTTKKLSVNYKSLAPGEYSFQIYATDIHENDTELKVVNFTILNPWYKRTETFIYSTLLMVGLLSLFYFIKLKQIKTEEAKKREYTRRIAEQKMKALRAQMNPHFIFNVLSSIQGAIRSQDIETADDYLVCFAELIRKFLDFSDTESVSLKEEIELLKLYTSVENLRFDSSINVIFDIDARLNLDDVFIPSMLIQPFVENAINHGLFYKKENRILSVRFLKKGSALYVEIEDNGIGRDKSMNSGRKHVTKHSSKALLNIKARIETLKAIEDIDIRYEVIDKKNKEDKSEGTLVILKFGINDHKGSNN